MIDSSFLILFLWLTLLLRFSGHALIIKATGDIDKVPGWKNSMIIGGHDAVFTFVSSSSIDSAHMSIFCKSLRESSPSTVIIVFAPAPISSERKAIASETKSILVEYDKESFPEPFRNMHLTSLRWILLESLYEKLAPKDTNTLLFNRIIVATVDDALFTADPFPDLFPKSLQDSNEGYFATFIEKNEAIGEGNLVSSSIISCFGDNTLNVMKTTVALAGNRVIFGTGNVFMENVGLMVRVMLGLSDIGTGFPRCHTHVPLSVQVSAHSNKIVYDGKGYVDIAMQNVFFHSGLYRGKIAILLEGEAKVAVPVKTTKCYQLLRNDSYVNDGHVLTNANEISSIVRGKLCKLNAPYEPPKMDFFAMFTPGDTSVDVPWTASAKDSDVMSIVYQYVRISGAGIYAQKKYMGNFNASELCNPFRFIKSNDILRGKCDIHSIHTPDSAFCCSYCLDDRQCTSFTFSQNTCYLKNCPASDFQNLQLDSAVNIFKSATASADGDLNGILFHRS